MGTVSGWGEGIVLSVVFIIVLSIVIGGFNVMYNKNYSAGLDGQVNTTKALFVEYQENSQDKIRGGEVQFDAQQGITLKSSYGIMMDFGNVVWSFFSGGWIETIIGYLNLGDAGVALAWGLRILWMVSVVFGILYALFKVVF